MEQKISINTIIRTKLDVYRSKITYTKILLNNLQRKNVEEEKNMWKSIVRETEQNEL